jgi:hypothetical protein
MIILYTIRVDVKLARTYHTIVETIILIRKLVKLTQGKSETRKLETRRSETGKSDTGT